MWGGGLASLRGGAAQSTVFDLFKAHVEVITVPEYGEKVPLYAVAAGRSKKCALLLTEVRTSLFGGSSFSGLWRSGHTRTVSVECAGSRRAATAPASHSFLICYNTVNCVRPVCVPAPPGDARASTDWSTG